MCPYATVYVRLLLCPWGVISGENVLLERIAALESQVDILTEELKWELQQAVLREAHIADLVSTVVATARGNCKAAPALCPLGTVAFPTKMNPSFEICVQVRPHVVDMSIVSQGLWHACADLRNLAIYLAFLSFERPILFVDVGANIGACAIYLAVLGRSTWDEHDIIGDVLPYTSFVPLPAVRVAAVEADPLHAAMIRASASLNHVEGAVMVYERIAWATSGQALGFRRFDHLKSQENYVDGNWSDVKSRDTFNTHSVRHATDTLGSLVSVPTIALDELFAEEISSGHPILLKLDIELSEMHALRGARKLFDANVVKLVHFEFRSRGRRDGATGLDLLKFFTDRGFYLLCMWRCTLQFPSLYGIIDDIDELDRLVIESNREVDLIAIQHHLSTAQPLNATTSLLRDIHELFKVRRLKSTSEHRL